MKILFLDDDLARHAFWQEQIPPSVQPGVVAVHTAAGAIAALAAAQATLVGTAPQWIFLDHDLGGEVFCDSARSDTGMEVVRWMVQQTQVHPHCWKEVQVVIHTMNSQARALMTQALTPHVGGLHACAFGSAEFLELLRALPS